MAASSNGPRYAPEDPTLPKPWRGLIDGKTGYLYFWNPETNVTQYERPVPKQPSGQLPPPPPKSNLTSVSSSVHAQHLSGISDHGHRRDSKEEDARDAGSRSHHHYQTQRGSSGSHSQSQPNGEASAGHGASHGYGHGHTSQSSRLSVKHNSSDVVGGLSVEQYRHRNEISVLGDDVPVPFMTFESTGFSEEMLREVRHAGFSAPTPIQAQAWPIVIQSRDVVAIAKTGSGKTLGYLFPGFMHLNRLRNNPRAGPTVLVLAPTRELATQIQDEVVKFGRSSRISSTCLYGGAPKGPQLRDIDRGVDVVVATPGRLNDILEMRRISLRQVSYLVLDEADRMLDMGFEPQIRKIVKEIPPQRQTLMFTATWPKEVRKIAADLLVKPVQVNIGSIDELVANKAITQYVEVIKPGEKQRRLEQILRSQEPASKILIFCSTKKMCDQLSRSLTRQFGAAAIHGDKSQKERDYVLGQFRSGRSPILVATDVAARGLDIKDIRVVINYDFPTGIEDYVHRIGRTGRAGATGVAYTFFSDQDSKHASDLVKVLEGAAQRVPREILDMSSRTSGRGKFRRWASANRIGAATRDVRNDSGYGGYGERTERGMESSNGRFEADRGVRVQGDNDRDRSYNYSQSGDTRMSHDIKSIRSLNERRAGERDPDMKGASGANVRRVGDRNVVRGRGRSRSPVANKGRVVVGIKRSRSRSRSRDHRGRSPARRSRSRSRSPVRMHAGGVLKRETSPKRTRVSSPGPTSANTMTASPGGSYPQYENGVPGQQEQHGNSSPPLPVHQEQWRSTGPANGNSSRPSQYVQSPIDGRQSPVNGNSPRHAQYDRSTLMEDKPSPVTGNSPPNAHYHQSPTPVRDRPSPVNGNSPRHAQYYRSPPGDDRLHLSGYDRSPSPREGGMHSAPPKKSRWESAAIEPTKQHTGSPVSDNFANSSTGNADKFHSMPNPADEEEEGMIHADAEGAIPIGMHEE